MTDIEMLEGTLLRLKLGQLRSLAYVQYPKDLPGALACIDFVDKNDVDGLLAMHTGLSDALAQIAKLLAEHAAKGARRPINAAQLNPVSDPQHSPHFKQL